MQALYPFFLSDNNDITKGEKELFNSIDKMYDLYILLLLLLSEVHQFAEKSLEEAKQKRLPTKEELSPSTRFIDNRLLRLLSSNLHLQKLAQKRKLSWVGEEDLVKKTFLAIKNSKEYSAYLGNVNNDFNADKEFISAIFVNHITYNDLINHYLEEKCLYWKDDLNFICSSVVKTIQSFQENSDEHFLLMEPFKDEADDQQFVAELFRKTIIHESGYRKLIEEKTKNWEIERIASMDVLLMKMALCEFLNFNEIPVKVSFNEYIEISKNYSSPKSKIFINGILDKLVAELTKEKKIKKTGRGLME